MYLSLLFLGVILMIGGIFNWRGDISAVHWYNRLRVSEADTPKYAKTMGLGTMIAGGSTMLSAVLLMIFHAEPLFYLLAAGLVFGVAVILYAQFKYNRGIF